jgi:hypothetical protein
MAGASGVDSLRCLARCDFGPSIDAARVSEPGKMASSATRQITATRFRYAKANFRALVLLRQTVMHCRLCWADLRLGEQFDGVMKVSDHLIEAGAFDNVIPGNDLRKS